MVKKVIPVFVILFFALFAGLALLHSGMLPTHDGEYHVLRFYEFYKTVRSGVIYPRWAQDFNFGFGLPLFNYVYPLPNYIATLLHVVGFSFIDAFKMNMFLALICGAIGMYIWSRKYWGKPGGVLSAIFYTYAPYHFVDIYIRGSVGEVWAIGLFPLFLWAYDKALVDNRSKWSLFSSILLALIIFSHNILALGFFIFFITYITLFTFTSPNKAKVIFRSITIIMLGLGISAIFWLPALGETSLVTGLQVFDLQSNFADLFQLLIPSWWSGFFGSSLGDVMSVQIGLANLFVIFATLILIPFYIKKKKKNLFLVLFSSCWIIILFFLMQKISLPLWNYFPLLHYFQFPWRWLSILILVVSFLAGNLVNYASNYKALFVFLLLLLLSTTWQYASPAHYLYRVDDYYFTRSNFIDSTNSPGNVFNTIWLAGKVSKRERFSSQNLVIILRKPEYLILKAKTNKSFTEVMPLAYFPGWEATVNDKQIPLLNSEGRIQLLIPAKTTFVILKRTNTRIEMIATAISIVSIVAIGILVSLI